MVRVTLSKRQCKTALEARKILYKKYDLMGMEVKYTKHLSNKWVFYLENIEYEY